MSNQQEHVIKIRKYLRNKLINCTNKINNYEKQRLQICNLIKFTVLNGESNSALIIGPRGSGKTRLLKDVLDELSETINVESNAIIIELNGLVHTDDKLALKSCTVQMNLEKDVDGKVFGTFAENLAFLLECLRSGRRKSSKGLIFILEEFDLFCAHSNQTLLYNLLDMTHSSQSPICVIGLTTRLDVIELFEKRVKSRFSHRQIYLFPGNDITLEMILERVKELLSVTDSNIHLPVNSKINWNNHITRIIKNQNFINALQRLHDLTLCESVLKNILIILVSQLDSRSDKLKVECFIDLVKNYEKDSRISTLESLSVLELCLVIAMKHHVEIYDQEPFNFEMILERYNKFANHNAITQSVQRSVVLKAFEHVKSLEIIAPVSSFNSRLQKEYEFYHLLVLPGHLESAIKQYTGIPTEVQQWANSSIT